MKIALVCSNGGHLTELEMLADAWSDHEVFWITYDSPRTRARKRTYRVHYIGLNPWWMAVASARIARILLRERPRLLISSGPEIAIPAFYLARLLGIRTIFIEVWTRVSRPTGAGRFVYPIANHFFVQWPEMLERYGARARFEGALW